MKQIKWFDRKFKFPDDENLFPSIIERLSGTPIRLADKIAKIKGANMTLKIKNSWSIADNIGHLIDLEPLWQGRLEDVLNGKEVLRHADLENRKTDLANHSSKNIEVLLNAFSNIRSITMAKLELLNDKEIYQHALHPRLKTPMRIMDLFLFVAEHDDHHLARITEINKQLK